MKRNHASFIAYIMIVLLVQPGIVLSQPASSSGLYHSLQQRMDSFKQHVTCAFSKRGCTKDQYEVLVKSAAVIIGGLIILGLGMKAHSIYRAHEWQQQNSEAQQLFKQGQQNYSLPPILQAVREKGFIIGTPELKAIKTQYEGDRHFVDGMLKRHDERQRELGLQSKKEMDDFKDGLRDYFKDGKHSDQLKAEREFWKWMTTISKE